MLKLGLILKSLPLLRSVTHRKKIPSKSYLSFHTPHLGGSRSTTGQKNRYTPTAGALLWYKLSSATTEAVKY